MPDLSRNLHAMRKPHPSAWIPQASTAAILVSVAGAILVFVRTLVGLRDRLGYDDPKVLAALGLGFILMEIYLWRRAWTHARAARDLYRRARGANRAPGASQDPGDPR